MTSPSRLPAAQIPNITELRRQLDYGDPSLKRCVMFYDHLRVYRKTFTTSDGMSGTDLYEWKDPDVQTQLDEMTTAYLDKDGNGHVFWPKDESAANFNSLTYSRDREKIRRLVKQLIFRLNQQQFRNHKYKKKDHGTSDNLSRRGTSVDNPIDVDSPVREARSASPSSTKIPTNASDPTSRRSIVKLKLPKEQIDLTRARTKGIPMQPPAGSTMERLMRGAEGEALAQRLPVSATTQRDDSIYDFPPDPSSVSRKRPPGDRPATTSPPDTEKRSKQTASIRASSSSHQRLPPSPSTPRHPSSPSKRNRQSTVRASHKVRRAPEAVSTIRQPFRQEDDLSADDCVPRISDDIDADASRHPSKTQEEPLLPSVERAQENEASTRTATDMRSPTRPSIQNPLTVEQENESKQQQNHSIATNDAMRPSPTHSQKHAKEEAQIHDKPKMKPKVEIMYQLILSRSPVYESRGWTPAGSFQEMTIAQLLEQLPFPGDVKDLNFSLEGPGLRIKESMESTNEIAFSTMKRRFNKGIRAALANNAASDETLVFELEIEPKREAMAVSEDEDDLTSFF